MAEEEDRPELDDNPDAHEGGAAEGAGDAVQDGEGQQEDQDNDEALASKLAANVGKAASPDLIAHHLSLLARTGNGLSFAYTRLELRSAQITNIDALESYPHLRYIDLSENLITAISPLSAHEYLLAIDFHGNPRIREVPASIDRRKYLQQANFAACGISTFSVATWPMCRWLNLSGNRLKELKLESPGFGELVHLEVRGNKLEKLLGSAFGGRKLEVLYLANNKIKTVELEDKPNLHTLHLRDNQIVSLSGFSESLKALSTLNLRKNLVESLEEVAKLAVLPNLKSLTLSENPLTEIPNYRLEVIKRLPKLEKLDKESVTDEERGEAELLNPPPPPEQPVEAE